MNRHILYLLRQMVILSFCLTVLSVGNVQAKPRDTGDQFTMAINISGKVVANGACTFDQKGTLAVDFSDVKYKTDSSRNTLEGTYIQPLASSMSCSGDSEGKTQMKLDTTTGEVVSYLGVNLLPVMNASSSQSDSLGIRLQVNGTSQSVGEWFDVDMKNPPALKAELVQFGDGSDFIDGSTFTANATLTMAFN
ncbi:fimbrial protein [Citrobacter braakii]|nr:fimbrial protein [Citrobacter braakii]